MHPDLAEYGPIRFQGDANALYDRHLLFDYAIDPDLATPRERYEAIAHSLRDVLALRWLRTKKTHYNLDAKRAYYLSMEFLIGRSLANNVSNLLLDSAMRKRAAKRMSIGTSFWNRSPMPALVMEAWGGWRRVSSTRWPPWSCRPWDMACATSTASSSRRFATDGKTKSRITGCAAPIRGKWSGSTISSSSSWVLIPDSRRTLTPVPESLDNSGNPLRPSRGGLRGPDHQHPSAVGRRRAG